MLVSLDSNPDREIETNFSYEYVIDYNIYNLINLDNKPCRPELNWREDECKLTQVRREVRAVPVSQLILIMMFS